jgi:hypothetical protein
LTTVLESLAAAEKPIQAGQGIVSGFFIDVRVDLHRGRDVRMAEDHLRVARRYAQLLEQGRGGVPQVMDPDHPELVVVADAAEGPDQVPGFDRTTAAGSEHESGILPGAPECLAVSGLLLLTNEQRFLARLGMGSSRLPARVLTGPSRRLPWMRWSV